MKTQTTSCPKRETLEGFLASSLDQSQTDRTEQHLSTCAECQERLVKLSAGADMWSEARSLLSDQDTPLTDEPLRPIDENLIAAILGPTDDPHMLGRIGTYEISGIIGHGGTGIVFKAFDAKLNRFVAIKVLSPTLARNASARARFEREGQAIAAVSHDHVVPVYAVDEFRGIPYLVMQYVPGQSLQQRINEQGPLQPKQTVRIGMQVAQALACAHAQGVIHRDVKPANVLLVNGIEKVQVGDFGLAQVADDASMTRSGMIAGTPQYMSPEQTLGEPLDGRSDLFSLGSVMYAMCTGHPPFRAETVMGVIHRIANKEARPIRQVNPDTPVWLEQFVARLLQKSPDDRFKSADEVATYLSQELASMQQPQESATTDRDWQTKGKRTATYFPGAWLLLPCAILLLAFLVQAVKSRKDGPPAAAATIPPTASLPNQIDEPSGLPPAHAEKSKTPAVFNNNTQAQINRSNDAALTLELLELTHSVHKASVAASYYLGVRDLKTQKGEQLFALRGLGAGFTMVDSRDSKLFPESRFRFRLFIPSFENPRHSSFLARNTIRMPLAFDELQAVSRGNRYVFAVVLPTAETDGSFASDFDTPKGDAIERVDYETGTSQSKWYRDLKKSNDIICVVEATLIDERPHAAHAAPVTDADTGSVPVEANTAKPKQAPTEPSQPDKAECTARLAGSWLLESEAQYGSVQAERDQTAESPGVTLSFQDETLTAAFDQPWKPITWKIEFDNVKDPQAIYLSDEDSGKKMSLRFRFVREYLEVCFSRRHPDRLPTKFGTAKHVDSIVWRLSPVQLAADEEDVPKAAAAESDAASAESDQFMPEEKTTFGASDHVDAKTDRFAVETTLTLMRMDGLDVATARAYIKKTAQRFETKEFLERVRKEATTGCCWQMLRDRLHVDTRQENTLRVTYHGGNITEGESIVAAVEKTLHSLIDEAHAAPAKKVISRLKQSIREIQGLDPNPEGKRQTKQLELMKKQLAEAEEALLVQEESPFWASASAPRVRKVRSMSVNPEQSASSTPKRDHVSFFGIDDKGKRIVYLLDCSGSAGGDHFSRARAELIASLDSLAANGRFQVLLFNDTVTPLSILNSDSTDGMHTSSEELVSSAIRILRSHQPDGATDPKPALVAGLANLKPDVIYMVTDGGEPKLTRSDLDALKRLNAKRTRIHCIELGEGSLLSSPTWLQTLAQENGGQYKYVDAAGPVP